MSLDNTTLEASILEEFEKSSQFNTNYQSIENYSENFSENLSQAIKTYILGLVDDDGDSLISPIIITSLKASIKDALQYNPLEPDSIDINRLDLAIQTNLISILVGLQFNVVNIPIGWLTKISSSTVSSIGQIIFLRRSVSDKLSITNQDSAKILADQIRDLVSNTTILTIGTQPGSPPTPIQKTVYVN